MIQIWCKNNNVKRTFPVGTTLQTIYNELQLDLPYGAVSAKVNNQVEGLTYRVYHNKDIEFLTLLSSSGMRTYVRSLCFVLCKAVEELHPGVRITLEHPISKGYFCHIKLGRAIEPHEVTQIKERMQQLIAKKLPFHRHEKHTTEVIELFRAKGMLDKVKLLEGIGDLYAYYYTLGDTIDYYYGSLLPSTGHLTLFDLSKYSDGLLLRIPNRSNPTELEEITQQEKMLEVFQEHYNWNEILGITTVGDLNMACNKGEATTLINLSEALQEKKIIQIADQIQARSQSGRDVRVVLISGPSSSGKTTFSKRLSVQLMVNGRRPFPISLDNYFVNRVNTPRDETGDYDYESIYALDLALFNDHLVALMNGEEIELPTYNFTTGEREYNGEKLKIEKDHILIIEGIHALNPELIPHIPSENCFKVYVSALTTISIDDHNYIPTTDNRLLRRILRDYKYRGYSAEDTISRWQSVRAGEDKWIFPYQENADAMFNSALLFELAVLKDHLEPILRKVPNSKPEYSEAYRLYNFLAYFTSVEDGELPPTSLLREFLGGSSFRY
ncbi:MAG: nucleoside kinase [Phocaeicola sp.]